MDSSWNKQHVVISGGTSGLGKHLALELAKRGASLALIGRDRDRLQGVQAEVASAGASHVATFSIDVAKASAWNDEDSDGNRFLDYIREQPVHLLINAVGRSDRGLLSELSEGDLVDAFRINVLSTFHMTRACWSGLVSASGCVVNIASLAGIVAGPGLGGYPMAKHALVAMHRQWRLESSGSGVHFLLVCPGPIEREDSGDRYADLVAERGLDRGLSQPGGGVQLHRLSPQELCVRILDGVVRKELELVLPGKAKWLSALMPLWPSWADRMVRNKFSRRDEPG